MIFTTIHPNTKKTIVRVIVGVGFVLMMLGFFTDIIAYQWGIVIFVFSFVIAGIVRIIVGEPEQPHVPEPEDSHIDKVLKS